jgi:lycopene cyclase domain-containing protein
MKYTYLLLNIFTISIPFIFSFHKKLNFYKTWKAFFPAVFITAAVFIIWDIYFTSLGVWGFNPEYLLGVNVVNLPLEEWLFFFCIPYAIVFTYASIKRLINQNPLKFNTHPISMGIALILLLIAIFKFEQIYTSVTFLSTSVFLIIHIFFFKSDYMGKFYLSYLIIFIGPFLLINGILTGLFIQDQVVWYNNTENLSFRIFTIPVEDFVYGFLLYLMNVSLYEYFMRKFKISNP